jgi:hypothetical protein
MRKHLEENKNHELIHIDKNESECLCGGWTHTIVDKSLSKKEKSDLVQKAFKRHVGKLYYDTMTKER